MLDPIIILIGGAAGTSKTSTGKVICQEFDIAHRLGSGFLREYSKGFVSKENNAYLYNYSFSPHDDSTPFDNLYYQSEILKKGINLCVNRAHNEGTSLLIEGVNVIPGLFDYKKSVLQIVLIVEDYDQHFKMMKGKTHSKRNISENDFKQVRKIQNEFILRAKEFNWSTINLSSTSDIIKKIEVLLKEKE